MRGITDAFREPYVPALGGLYVAQEALGGATAAQEAVEVREDRSGAAVRCGGFELSTRATHPVDATCERDEQGAPGVVCGHGVDRKRCCR